MSLSSSSFSDDCTADNVRGPHISEEISREFVSDKIRNVSQD